ncbi:MFS transporter [Pseudonocardia spinosispora]|uniref:MFS transporter n=1 Tax=Pseudonocardia spinosispora TaxID=103441 RepID=UPI00042A4F7E|nr:MFS transporter [Pseudonocardia spinosispora]
MSARTYLLAGGSFAVGTSAYVVSGVLPAVSSDLHVSLTAAGQLSTAFALSYAVGAPLLATVTARWERRTLLFVALLVAGLGNGLAALAPNYPLLLAARVIAAFGAAVYTPAATLVATGLLPAAERGRAVAVVFGGLTMAMVVGVPLGNLLSGSLGYRGVFGVIALVCLIAAALVVFLLPKVAPAAPVALRERFAVAADRRVLIMLAITIFGVLGAMSVYTYVVPLLGATAGVSGPIVGVLLLAYGVGGVVGNTLGGFATDRIGAMRTLMITMVGFVVAVGTLPLTATTVVGAGFALFAWSAFTWAFNPPVQNLLIELAPEGGLLLSINASAIYFGAGLSGVVGGLVISAVGPIALPVIASGLGVVVIGLVLVLRSVMAKTPAPSTAPVEVCPAGAVELEHR